MACILSKYTMTKARLELSDIASLASAESGAFSLLLTGSIAMPLPLKHPVCY